jgi:hypothetical protein
MMDSGETFAQIVTIVAQISTPNFHFLSCVHLELVHQHGIKFSLTLATSSCYRYKVPDTAYIRTISPKHVSLPQQFQRRFLSVIRSTTSMFQRKLLEQHLTITIPGGFCKVHLGLNPTTASLSHTYESENSRTLAIPPYHTYKKLHIQRTCTPIPSNPIFTPYQKRSSSVICFTISVFDTMSANSSNDSLPSPSRSASMIVLSTICWSCWSFRLFPTCSRGQ